MRRNPPAPFGLRAAPVPVVRKGTTMTRLRTAALAVALGLVLVPVHPTYAQTGAAGSSPAAEEIPMTEPSPDAARSEATAEGTFDVQLTPQPAEGEGEGAANLGRMTIDKTFHGDLEGTSKGQMLSAMGEVQGSAGYVAIERVTGTLGGRSGSFVLQHSATMDRGAPHLVITVVPDSGSGELTGLSGEMGIEIEDGKHFYRFDYSLPDAPAADSPEG